MELVRLGLNLYSMRYIIKGGDMSKSSNWIKKRKRFKSRLQKIKSSLTNEMLQDTVSVLENQYLANIISIINHILWSWEREEIKMFKRKFPWNLIEKNVR